MYFKPLLIPLLAQVALTFVVMIIMYRKRVTEMKTKRIHPQRTKTRSKSLGVLPDSETAANNYANLFESPVLFYTAILLTDTDGTGQHSGHTCVDLCWFAIHTQLHPYYLQPGHASLHGISV